jgi:hypothetical protein
MIAEDTRYAWPQMFHNFCGLETLPPAIEGEEVVT